MQYIRDYQLTFSDAGEVAGKMMHRKLLEHGHDMEFITPQKLNTYLVHVNHATMVINPQLGSRNRTIRRGLRRIKKVLSELQAEQILQDDTLDQATN